MKFLLFSSGSAAAAEQGRNVALLPAGLLDVLHIFLHARIGVKVGFDKLARLFARYADILRERESEMPYTMPKLTALHEERICGVTSSSGTW